MVSKKIVLRFPPKLAEDPIVYKLVKDYDLVFNILRARIMPQEEGELVIELKGNKESYANGIKYLKDLGIKIEPLSQDVTRDEERCTHCGVCIVLCPTDALSMDRKTMRVNFDATKCIACELCVNACPPRAMKVKL